MYSFVQYFTRIGSLCRPCGAKTPKIDFFSISAFCGGATLRRRDKVERGLVSPVRYTISQEIGWEEKSIRSDLFCVEWDAELWPINFKGYSCANGIAMKLIFKKFWLHWVGEVSCCVVAFNFSLRPYYVVNTKCWTWKCMRWNLWFCPSRMIRCKLKEKFGMEESTTCTFTLTRAIWCTNQCEIIWRRRDDRKSICAEFQGQWVGSWELGTPQTVILRI